MSDRSPDVRICRLDTIGGVVMEMDVIYRRARRGEIEVEKARKLFHLLEQICAGLEASDIERRIEALEARRP